jgi:hypothetical protein
LKSHLIIIIQLGDAFQDWYIRTFGKSATAEVITHCHQELVQAIWQILLSVGFMVEYCHRIMMECADGIMRRFFLCFFFSTELIIQRSLFILFVLMLELTIPHCRTILACIKYLGNYPCPRCLISKADISKLGTKRDRKVRNSKECMDNENQQSKIQLVQDWIYKGGSGIVSAAVERILGPKSLIQMHVSFTLLVLNHNFLTKSRMLSRSDYQHIPILQDVHT